MFNDELYEESWQGPGLAPSVQTDIVRRWLLSAQTALLHWVLGSEWSSLIGPDTSRYSALIGGWT